MVGVVLFLLSLSRMVIFLYSLRECFDLEDWTLFELLRLRVMLMRVWFSKVGYGRLTELVMMLLMRLLTLGVGGLAILSLMRVVICLGFVDVGILSFLIFIDSSLPFLGLLLTMMIGMVLLLILWYGLQVLVPRGVGWFRRFGIGHFCPGRLVFGILSGLVCLHLLSVLRTLLVGPVLLVFWLSGLPF